MPTAVATEVPARAPRGRAGVSCTAVADESAAAASTSANAAFIAHSSQERVRGDDSQACDALVSSH
eukprot:762463-Prymnesium_polylepis.1